jgi:HEAT repeats
MAFLDLFRPKWKHSSSPVRDTAIANITDEKKLTHIAKTSKHWGTRLHATEKLINQTALADIAQNDESEGVRTVAIKKLTDQRVLADIVWRNRDWHIIITALEKLTDQAILSEIAKKYRDLRVREAATKKLTDQAVLIDIAKCYDEDDYLRMAVVKKLTDQAVLTDLATRGLAVVVREAATKKLTDQAVLTDLATRDLAVVVREAATENLNDQTVLIAIATNGDENSRVRKAAAGKLTDQAVLTDLATSDSSSTVRTAATEKLNDQAVLANIAMRDSEYSVRMAATKNLTDQVVLIDIARSDEVEVVREAALDKITDESLLADITENDDSYYVRKNAMDKLYHTNGGDFSKLTNQVLLADIARNDKAVKVRAAATKKLTDQAVLSDIAKIHADTDVRKIAIKKLTNQSVLFDLALNDIDEEIRKAAMQEIADPRDRSYFKKHLFKKGVNPAEVIVTDIIECRSFHDIATQNHLIQLLCKIEGPKAVKSLVTILSKTYDESDIIRTIAAALSKIGSPDAKKALMNMLTSGDQARSESALKFLNPADFASSHARLKVLYWVSLDNHDELIKLGAEAVKPLIDILSDGDWPERSKCAAEVLGKLNDSEGAAALLEALKETHDFDLRDASAVALDALGFGFKKTVALVKACLLGSSIPYYGNEAQKKIMKQVIEDANRLNIVIALRYKNNLCGDCDGAGKVGANYDSYLENDNYPGWSCETCDGTGGNIELSLDIIGEDEKLSDVYTFDGCNAPKGAIKTFNNILVKHGIVLDTIR